MPRNNEKLPSDEAVRGEVFCPEDWIGGRNTRNLTHMARRVLRSVVRSQLDGLLPFLATNNGFCFFKTFAYDSEYRILLTNHMDIAGEANTIISINQARQPNFDEPYFPDGQVLSLTDVTVPDRSQWMNTAYETLYRDHHTHSWDKPEYATVLSRNANGLILTGNISHQYFGPEPARDLQDVASDADALWTAHSALVLCHEGSFEPEVRHIVND